MVTTACFYELWGVSIWMELAAARRQAGCYWEEMVRENRGPDDSAFWMLAVNDRGLGRTNQNSLAKLMLFPCLNHQGSGQSQSLEQWLQSKIILIIQNQNEFFRQIIKFTYIYYTKQPAMVQSLLRGRWCMVWGFSLQGPLGWAGVELTREWRTFLCMWCSLVLPHRVTLCVPRRTFLP